MTFNLLIDGKVAETGMPNVNAAKKRAVKHMSAAPREFCIVRETSDGQVSAVMAIAQLVFGQRQKWATVTR